METQLQKRQSHACLFACLCVLDTRLSPYSKLLLTSPAQALNMLEEEKAILQVQLSQEEDAPSCFIQSALCLLQVNCDRRLSLRCDTSSSFQPVWGGCRLITGLKTIFCCVVLQEREEELLKQLKANIGDGFDLSSLTLDEPASEPEVQTITSHSKVSPGCCCAAVMLSL